MTEKELKPKAKEEVKAKGERVRPGRVFLPAVDIFETPEALTLVADMPGVPNDKVTLDIKDNHLIISGGITPPMGEGETMLSQEYYTGDFQREFHLGATIDQARIEASMKDGVLRLLLPKAEKAKPRKIEVKVG
ncbi:MAG: Hsp20/alpha crystallin family protein [Deltaproteobacteria bacterium]|nr:MAG: Hsp20/alpha crystallin family protein [Deltaproteobacteria bacterium]